MDKPPNPRRVAAGQANRKLRGPLSDAGRQRLREAARQHKPWLASTGPRTAKGKAQAVKNGKTQQVGPFSHREVRADLAAARAVLAGLRAAMETLEE